MRSLTGGSESTQVSTDVSIRQESPFHFFYVLCVQIRIFARKPAIDAGQGDYALNITGKILNFFEDYYGVPYPLPKSGESSSNEKHSPPMPLSNMD